MIPSSNKKNDYIYFNLSTYVTNYEFILLLIQCEMISLLDLQPQNELESFTFKGSQVQYTKFYDYEVKGSHDILLDNVEVSIILYTINL